MGLPSPGITDRPPAIKLADHGFAIDPVLAEAIENNEEKLKRSATRHVIFDETGEPLDEGELLVQDDLAKTLKQIRAKGTEAFYKGPIADAIAETVQEFGGSMTPDDLARYDVTIDEPIWGKYKGYDTASMPPPSSGGVFLLQMLDIWTVLTCRSMT